MSSTPAKPKVTKKFQTGSAHLKRKFLFNKNEQDIDVPDGDILTGKKVYNDECASCHHMKLNTLSPPLQNIFGKTAGTVKGFLYYSPKCRGLGVRWSKQKLYKLLDDPEAMLGLQSGMTFSGLKDPYERSSLIEYLCYLRYTNGYKVQPHWIN